MFSLVPLYASPYPSSEGTVSHFGKLQAWSDSRLNQDSVFWPLVGLLIPLVLCYLELPTQGCQFL